MLPPKMEPSENTYILAYVGDHLRHSKTHSLIASTQERKCAVWVETCALTWELRRLISWSMVGKVCRVLVDE